jgi:hypothetical protein
VLHIGDGPLSARRIMGLDLRGAVVVLSACEGGLHAGCLAEPLGLVWACLAAGARAVVAAGWSVDDAATAELMTHFYREIEAGRDARVALARARRLVATERPHPYFWAAFRYLAAPTHALVEGAAGEWSVDAEAAAPGLSPEVPSWMDQEATSTH